MTCENKTCIVTTNIKPPFVMFNETSKKWSGLIVDYMEMIATELGIHYEFREARDKSYGYENTAGKWGGMIGELVRKEADIAFGGLSQTAYRSTVVDFTEPFYNAEGFGIIMKRREVKTKLWGWLTSLEFNVWLCIIAAYLVTSILVWIFDTWSPYAFRNCQQKYIDDSESAKRFFTLKESLWYCFTALTPQGGGEAPKCFSARLTSATWWLFGFIIIASYTANMAAHLTLIRLEFTIENYHDLTRQLRVQYGPVQNSTADHYYQRMADIEGQFYEIWRSMTLNNSLSPWERSQLAVWEYPVGEKYGKMYSHMMKHMPKTLNEAVNRVLEGNKTHEYALIAEYPDVVYNTMIHCELKMLPDILTKMSYSIAVRKGSSLKSQLNSVIYNYSNTDYMDRLKKKWWDHNPEKKDCPFIDDRTPGLIIENIGGLFMFISIGVICGYVTLIWEFAYFGYISKKLDDIGHYVDERLHIIEKLDQLGITKLKRPCKLSDPEIESVHASLTPEIVSD